jgi:hypothetical protein
MDEKGTSYLMISTWRLSMIWIILRLVWLLVWLLLVGLLLLIVRPLVLLLLIVRLLVLLLVRLSRTLRLLIAVLLMWLLLRDGWVISFPRRLNHALGWARLNGRASTHPCSVAS